MSEQEKRERAAWQAANMAARRADTRGFWSECCGRPTTEPVAVCHDCADLARERQREEIERVISVERAKDAARSEWIA